MPTNSTKGTASSGTSSQSDAIMNQDGLLDCVQNQLCSLDLRSGVVPTVEVDLWSVYCQVRLNSSGP
jgi:hypothetical protein